MTNINTFPGNVTISSNVTAANSKFSLDTNGTFKQSGDANSKHIKMTKYVAAHSNMRIAQGSYSGDAFQWVSVRAKFTRLDGHTKTVQFDYLGTGGASSVKNAIVIGDSGAGANQASEVKVYNKTGDSTYEIYLQIDSAVTITVEIYHRGSNIDESYATLTGGGIDDTGLQKIFDSGTSARLRWAGTADSATLNVFNPINESTSGLLIEKGSGGAGTAAALFFGVNNVTENPGIAKAAIFYERNLVNGRGDIKFCNDSVNDANPVTTAAADTRMIIKNDGNVGIATVSPQSRLHIYPSNTIGAEIQMINFAPSFYEGYLGISATSTHTNALGADLRFKGRIYVSPGVGSTRDVMCLKPDGRVGIGTNGPVYPLHVRKGDSSFSYYGPNSYGNYLLVGAAPYSVSSGAATIMTTNGNLHIDPASGSSSIYLGYFAGGGVIYGYQPGNTLSDDRVKEDEKYIENSLQVLKKLKPQTYLQRRHLEDENSDRIFSCGLIAQEVYYDCPELRHILRIPKTAYVDSTKEISDDPQIDPDYSDWGEEAAGVKYPELIPYIISAVNQLSNEVSVCKIQISNVSFSNVLNYHGLVVSKNSDVYLSDQENDSKVYGVISDVKTETNDSEFLINYRGDSKVWVINVENIQAGDYITTSNVPGYATKQDGDTLKNYTVAKSSIDCDFIPPMIYKKRPVQTTRMVSRWKKHSNVTVSESTYLTLPEDIRDINSKSVYTLTSDNSVILSQDDYENLEDPESNLYTETTKLEYIYKSTQYEDFNPRGGDDWIEESISKTFDSLDENGQIIWENTDTQLPKYPIKYITIDGTETDQPNATYTAALIDCSIVCG